MLCARPHSEDRVAAISRAVLLSNQHADLASPNSAVFLDQVLIASAKLNIVIKTANAFGMEVHGYHDRYRSVVLSRCASVRRMVLEVCLKLAKTAIGAVTDRPRLTVWSTFDQLLVHTVSLTLVSLFLSSHGPVAHIPTQRSI